ncbi:MAG: hypothetical protein ACJAZF_004493 [Granulosicoccus sp.]|jgi:hypothetical protein
MANQGRSADMKTHVPADHLSAAAYLKERLGGKIGIGHKITDVQSIFGLFFNAGNDFERDGTQFDHLFRDNEFFTIGKLDGCALHTPGHTQASQHTIRNLPTIVLFHKREEIARQTGAMSSQAIVQWTQTHFTLIN